ncbi:hypothetical protein BJX63DRAFT_387688 [Aspergillus granulosus]|uniref:Uncharacterized protein n=1 Tax=Aspergillus granulosus TaxID=176169 RepID=A0ABR4HM54_9EURO
MVTSDWTGLVEVGLTPSCPSVTSGVFKGAMSFVPDPCSPDRYIPRSVARCACG